MAGAAAAPIFSVTFQLADGELDRRRHAQHREPIGPRESVPLEHSGHQVPGCRQRRTHKTRSTRRAIDHRDGQLWLQPHVVERIDLTKKLERLGIAAEQDVLPVIHRVAGG
jgi:hypothetical protein